MIHETYHSLVDRVRTTTTAVINEHPTVEPVLYRLRDGCARLLVDATCLRTRLRHEAPTDPYRLYRIDPAAITESISWQELSIDRGESIPEPFRLPNYHFAGSVLDGDWDADRRPFSESVVYRSFQAHFEAGVPWPETDLYAQCLDTIDAGGAPWGCTTPADVDRRCTEIDRLYETIESDGYRTQSALLESGIDEPFDHARPNTYTRTVDGEIALTVGRDGELLFYDGRNRLAIAKLLGLDAVPVVILVRHSQWQAVRDRVATGETPLASLPDRLQTHPDLVDLAE
ncbi:MAG: hypothetical protein U9O06_10955 [Euryarchaeota archaeon]|nr:hypothetical protein [Euryarchaeota archaeon]